MRGCCSSFFFSRRGLLLVFAALGEGRACLFRSRFYLIQLASGFVNNGGSVVFRIQSARVRVYHVSVIMHDDIYHASAF